MAAKSIRPAILRAAALVAAVSAGCSAPSQLGRARAYNPGREALVALTPRHAPIPEKPSPGRFPLAANHAAPARDDKALLTQVSHQEVGGFVTDDGLFDTGTPLSADRLAQLVQDRNPSLQAMYAAWQAAAARYPQEVALDDPMFDAMLAPASLASSSNVQESWSVEVSQKLPWFGKRGLRGEIADASANAAAWESHDARLQVTLAARLAFAEYLEAQLLRELNGREEKLLESLAAIAQTRYETEQAELQDVLQARVELADVQRRRVSLDRRQRVAAARINALLHRAPQAALPEPIGEVAGNAKPLEIAELIARAIENRPDLAAQGSRIQAESSAYCLAAREFYPDVEFYGRYDRYWFDREQQGSVGIKLNLPVQRDRRQWAVEESLARLSKANAEYESRVDQIGADVHASRERLLEAQRTLELLRQDILGAAEQNVDSARAGYELGKTSFLTLISAQRQLIEFRQQEIAATAELHRQSAELDRAVGAPDVGQ
jgi:outer membrane protein, heavy metal efflux system